MRAAGASSTISPKTEDSLSDARSSPRGRLRASTPNALIHQAFFPGAPEFLARYPELNLELVLTDRAVNLVEEGIDCAVRAVSIPDDSTLVAHHIASLYWLTCASPRYLAAHGTPRSISDLARHNCIRFISPSTGRTTDWRFENGKEQLTFTPRGNFGVTSLEGAVAAAAAGSASRRFRTCSPCPSCVRAPFSRCSSSGPPRPAVHRGLPERPLPHGEGEGVHGLRRRGLPHDGMVGGGCGNGRAGAGQLEAKTGGDAPDKSRKVIAGASTRAGDR